MIWIGSLPAEVRQELELREAKRAEVRRTYRGRRAQAVAYTTWLDSRWRQWWEQDSPPVTVAAQPEDDGTCEHMVELAKEILA